MNEPVTQTLSKPIEVIDQTVSSVTIMPPTGRHLMKAGPVMRLIYNDETGESAVEINPDKMGKLISVCCNIPMRSVEQMDASDFVACSNAITVFLAPGRTSSTSISTPDASGQTSLTS
jgi:hypothetical protein